MKILLVHIFQQLRITYKTQCTVHCERQTNVRREWISLVCSSWTISIIRTVVECMQKRERCFFQQTELSHRPGLLSCCCVAVKIGIFHKQNMFNAFEVSFSVGVWISKRERERVVIVVVSEAELNFTIHKTYVFALPFVECINGIVQTELTYISAPTMLLDSEDYQIYKLKCLVFWEFIFVTRKSSPLSSTTKRLRLDFSTWIFPLSRFSHIVSRISVRCRAEPRKHWADIQT